VRIEGLGEVEVVGDGLAEAVAPEVGVGGRLAGDGDVGAADVLVSIDWSMRSGLVVIVKTYALKNRPLPMRIVVETSSWESTSRRRWDRL
jgi:hypothetical protein